MAKNMFSTATMETLESMASSFELNALNDKCRCVLFFGDIQIALTTDAEGKIVGQVKTLTDRYPNRIVNISSTEECLIPQIATLLGFISYKKVENLNGKMPAEVWEALLSKSSQSIRMLSNYGYEYTFVFEAFQFRVRSDNKIWTTYLYPYADGGMIDQGLHRSYNKAEDMLKDVETFLELFSIPSQQK